MQTPEEMIIEDREIMPKAIERPKIYKPGDLDMDQFDAMFREIYSPDQFHNDDEVENLQSKLLRKKRTRH